MKSTYLVDISIPSSTPFLHILHTAVPQKCAQRGRRIRQGPFVCRRYQVSVCPLADHRPRPPMHCPFAAERTREEAGSFGSPALLALEDMTSFGGPIVLEAVRPRMRIRTNEERPLTLVTRPRSLPFPLRIYYPTNERTRASGPRAR